MSKHPSKQPLKTRRCSLKDLEARPVTVQDSWCYRPTIHNGQPVKPENWGYIVAVPHISKGKNNIFSNLTGWIIMRSKKIGGIFYLQIIPTDYPREYGVASCTADSCPFIGRSKKKKNPPILNIRSSRKAN